jgi:hypothetical protein
LLVVELIVFDPAEAKLKRRPYACRLHTEDATAEQLVSGVTLLGIVCNKLARLANEKYPGAIASYIEGDQVLKYGRGQVTGVEDAEGAPLAPPRPQEAVKDEDEVTDAPTGRTAPRAVPGPHLD